jgi:hypothetical protein
MLPTSPELRQHIESARRWRQPRVGLKDDVEHGPERWWAQLL